MLAGLGGFCYRHRRWVVLAWLGATVVLFAVGGRVFPRLGVEYTGSHLESFAGYDRLNSSAEYGPKIGVLLSGRSPTDPGVAAAVTAAVARTRALGEVARVRTPYDAPATGLVATDGRAFLLTVDLKPGLDRAGRDAALSTVEAALRPLGPAIGARVLFGGPTLTTREETQQVKRDTEHGELIALPITLAVMVVIFAGFLAAAIPVLGAIAAVAGGLAALYLFSFHLQLDPSVPSVTTVMGLGLSIDYALLLVSRYREELAQLGDGELAIRRTMATAGRTITFSALTVAVALSGMFLFNVVIFKGLAAAGLSVVLMALVAALSLTPALIGLFHARISPAARKVTDDGRFAALARATRRHAVLVVLVVAGLLLGLGSPFLHVQYRLGGVELLPTSFESRQYAEAVNAGFPGQGVDPVLVVARVPPRALDRYGRRVAGWPGVAHVLPAQSRLDGWAVLPIVPRGDSQGPAAQGLVEQLRQQRPAFTTWVTGTAAVLVDLHDQVLIGAPKAALWVGLATFVLLFLMTGSVLVPVKALLMNTLSLGATFGALVWVFQDGHFSGLLGFTPVSGLETWLPVLVFAFAFGLSMDYEVFLLSRIKELYDSGLPNDRAVEVGLQRSGPIITSAALLVVIVFAGFAAGRSLTIKELGVAMAIAVTVDATLVRTVLVPATMSLLGDLNWWAPGWLRRVHARVGLGEGRSVSGG